MFDTHSWICALSSSMATGMKCRSGVLRWLILVSHSLETMTGTTLSPSVAAPAWRLLGVEPARAIIEYASMRLMNKAVLPRGDGHPVVIFPGLAADRHSIGPLKDFCEELGYTAYDWGRGFNTGPQGDVDAWLDELAQHVRELTAAHAEPVSLIGWSLGGIYAREVAKALPRQTRCVITLGTPFTGNPRATNAWRFYEFVSGHRVGDPDVIAQVRKPPPVPTTSIYSRTDGIVAWRCSVNDVAPLAENIEVHASHVGMGMNPIALYAIADRLAQDPGHWTHFDASGARRWFFRTGLAAA